MRRKVIILSIILLASSRLCSAQNASNQFDLGLGVGNSEGSFSAAFIHQWHLGKKKKFSLGLGGRLTSYLGKNQYYLTAPAIITSGKKGPQVFFLENINENIDSLLIETGQLNAFNAGYQFNPKLSIGFNIDLFGLALGAKQQGRYFEGNAGKLTSARPTVGNILLVSDNDIGSLNSELYARFHFNEAWGIKGGLQFLFTEYTTDTDVQQRPEPNDRFRNKSTLFMAGVTYFIRKN